MAGAIRWDMANRQLIVSTSNGNGIALLPLNDYGEGNQFEGEAEVDQVRSLQLSDLHATFKEISDSCASTPIISLMVWSGRHSDNTGLHTLVLRPHWGTTLEIFVANPIFGRLTDAADTVKPMLSAHGCTVVEKSEIQSPDWGFHFVIRVPGTLRIGELIAVARAVDVLLERPSARFSTAAGTLSLVRAGTVEALVGQPESQWLEVKRKGYGMQNDGQKYELALDVAALANSDSGGLILIGFSTRKDAAGQDIIDGAPGCPSGSLSAESYADAIKHRVVPSIEGLVVEAVLRVDRVYLCIYVPPQPLYVQPFLVRGGVIAGDKISGAAFTIPNRVGSSKWSLSAEAVHTLLVAGRAVGSN